ncbi:hypothetical protein FRC05_005667 [Tulasnella sp. 425]|nr:hypothetical protein FRC05_005667 [Tulasnella sp. 425]
MASHNATSAISNRRHEPGQPYYLPVELLTSILNLRFPDTDDRNRSRKDMAELYDLRLVSKLWKEVVEDTPTLWTRVSVPDFPTTVVLDCLRRSKCHLLRISIGRYGHRKNSSDTHIKHLDLLQPHSHRWRTLTYNASIRPLIDYQRIKDFLESPAPMLQSISADLSAFRPVRTVNLAGGQAQALKHLRLTDVLLPWSSNLLHGLDTFVLWIQDTISVEEIVNLFTKSPALRSLRLDGRGAEGLNNAMPIAESTPDTTAASLEDVTILGYPPHFTSHILSHVSMPNCTSLSLSADFTTVGDLDILGNALAQFMPRIAEALSLDGRTRLLVSWEFTYEWSSSLEYEPFRFSFGFSGLTLESVIEWIRNLVATLECRLELEVILATSPRRTVEALGECNDVTKLIVSREGEPLIDGDDGDVSLLDYLGDVRADPVDGFSWPFPNIQELCVYGAGCHPLRVFGMLNKRYLPDTYVKVLAGQGISVRTPPQIDLSLESTDGDAITMAVLKHHWGVKSLNQEELGG